MTSRSRFTLDEARAAGERIGVDWGSAQFDVEQFRMGMDVELEHGTRDPETNVTDDDLITTAKALRQRQAVPPESTDRLICFFVLLREVAANSSKRPVETMSVSR